MNTSITKIFEARIFSKLLGIINDENIFEKTLNNSFTRKDIKRLIELVNTRGKHYFSTSERISFFKKLYERERMIEYMDKKCEKPFYRMYEIHQLLQKCVFHWQCDAIMLHILKSEDFYTQVRSLSGYETLITRRKQNLVEIQTN